MHLWYDIGNYCEGEKLISKMPFPPNVSQSIKKISFVCHLPRMNRVLLLFIIAGPIYWEHTFSLSIHLWLCLNLRGMPSRKFIMSNNLKE